MTDIDKEKLKKELQDVIPVQKDYDEKLTNIANKIDAVLSNKKSEHAVLDGLPHAHEKEHEHRTHSYDKFCPDCGKDNPDYDKNQYTCSSCGEHIGTKDEALNAVACPHCGKNEGAESSQEGWTI